MTAELRIFVDPEYLGEGLPEEKACFGAVGIRYGDVWLSESYDEFVNKVRTAPMLSAYHLAEWLAWNWWRLRWEGVSTRADWAFVHSFPSIGEGYVWPNISIFSDGQRIALAARPTPQRAATRFRYLANTTAVVDAIAFEYVAEQFIEQTRGLLRTQQVKDSNLDRIWNDINEERAEAPLARRRKIEALLGQNPDEGNGAVLNALILNDASLGARSVDELAADYPYSEQLLTLERLSEEARSLGFEQTVNASANLYLEDCTVGEALIPAWQVGTCAAKALRHQQSLGNGPITNDQLADLAGVPSRALALRTDGNPSISFSLYCEPSHRVVLRSRWETGRRFDLARLLGDRVISANGDRLLPATRSHTYRQKLQRSFAAELLSPFEAVEDFLSGDYGPESQEQAAHYFQVSPLAVRTLLVNHGRLEREDLNEFETVAASA